MDLTSPSSSSEPYDGSDTPRAGPEPTLIIYDVLFLNLIGPQIVFLDFVFITE